MNNIISDGDGSIVYVVGTGHYSDWHVVGVFSSKDKAEEYKNFVNGTIDEYTIDVVPEYPKNMLAYMVAMDKNGDVIQVEQIDGEDLQHVINSKGHTIFPTSYVGTRGMRFQVFAKDEEHAIKIVNEKRAMLIANNMWAETWEDFKKKCNERPEAEKWYQTH